MQSRIPGIKYLPAVLFISCLCQGVLSCKNQVPREDKDTVKQVLASNRKKAICCESNIPSRFVRTVAASYPSLKLPGGSASADGSGNTAGQEGVAQPAPIPAAASAPSAAESAAHKGMVWVAGGTFRMGADNKQALADEYPKHAVTVGGFWIDITEVTNAQFAAFVKATGYVTTAERKPVWEELK